MDIWLCLHFPLLPVEVFYRNSNTEETTDKPVVVLARQRIVCLNATALSMGVRTGNNMNTAYTISEQIVSFEQDEQKELATLSHLAAWAYRFTPSVTIRAPASGSSGFGGLLLEVSGCLKLFDGLDNLAGRIRSGLLELGFTANIAMARTPAAASCFAQAGLPGSLDDVPSAITDIPVACLQIEDTARDSLHQMGISTCGQLLDLPMDGLNRRFGVFFTDYLQRLTGARPDPQKFISEKPRFRSDLTFLADVTNRESLVFPMKRLLNELQDYLRGRQLMVNQFRFQLSHRSHAPREFTVFLANPDNDARMFLMLSQLQLEKLPEMPEVDNICLSAHTFIEAEGHSGDLFHGTRFRQKDGSMHSKAEAARAVRLLNMMTARLGPQACFGLSLVDDHRPEAAWRPIRLAGTGAVSAAMPLSADHAPRPLYLLREPRRLGTEPDLSGRLTLMQGPERIDYGWWDSNEVSRDYYIARHPGGAIYWIYQHLHNSEWYLHGIFS